MACPKCSCKTTYQYDDEDERCAACGEIFDQEDHSEEDNDEN